MRKNNFLITEKQLEILFDSIKILSEQQLTQNQILAQQQGYGVVSREYADQLANQGKLKKPDFSKPTFFSPPPLPVDWEARERETKFKEPLANRTQFIKGKRMVLPPQTNYYFYNLNKGNWDVKSVENINLWRDAPSGVLPSDLEKYLEFEKIRKKNDQTNVGVESTSIQLKSPKLTNPYHHPDFPLGATPSQIESRKKELEQANAERNQRIKGIEGAWDPNINQADATRVDMTRANYLIKDFIDKENAEIIRAINEKYGFIQQKINNAKSETDWETIGWEILKWTLYVLPVTAPYARIASVAFEFLNAANLIEQGKEKQAAVNILFSLVGVSPISTVVRDANLVDQVWFAASKTIIPKAEQEAANETLKKFVEEVRKKMVDKISLVTSEAAAKNIQGATFNLVKRYSSELKKQVGVEGGSKKYVKGKPLTKIDLIPSFIPHK